MLFNDRLEQGIVAARRSGQSLAVLFIDLDRFKNINDSLGHQVGDLLLKEVATRMLRCIRKGDTLSRLGGDEFVVTLEGLQQAEDAAQVAGKIIKALAPPVRDRRPHAHHLLQHRHQHLPASTPTTTATLMKNADTAMYHAKEKGRNNYQFFSPEMNVRAVERHNLETALRLAIERQEFVLFYQPQVDIRTGKVVGMEALLRWQHPERGLLSPDDVHHRRRGIRPDRAHRTMGAAQRLPAGEGLAGRGLPAAEGRGQHLGAPAQQAARVLPRRCRAMLNTTGLDPRYLELEMTESLLLKNAEENIAVLRKLGEDGVRIAVDDFGTGYSSLAVSAPAARSTRSRSTAASCATSRPTRTTRPSFTPWSRWRTASNCRSPPRAWKRAASSKHSGAWAATNTRAICSANRCRRSRPPCASSRRTSSIFAYPTLRATASTA